MIVFTARTGFVGELDGLKYRIVHGGESMFCSTCGKTINQGLSFCNHCGARSNGAIDHPIGKLSESSFNLLLGGILGIPIAGLGIVIGLMSVMRKEMGFSNGLIIAFTSISFLLLLAAEAAFIWMLLQNRTRPVKDQVDNAQVKDVVTKELGNVPVRELNEPMPSVTENTTRAFEPIHHKQKSR